MMKPEDAFKFCPRCGTKFAAKLQPLTCRNCKLHFYLNAKPCASLILTNKLGEILLVKRAYNPAKGFWVTPGGFLEKSETFEDGIQREAKEELGLELKQITYLGSVVHPYVYQEIEYRVVIAIFGSTIKEGTRIIVGDDATDYKFFPLKDFPYRQFAFPEIADWIRSNL